MLRLALEHPLEPQQSVVPGLSEFLDPPLEFFQGLWGQGVSFVAPTLLHRDQTGMLEDPKMFENTLAGDGKVF